ncbi:alpha-amylase family glycosyl hydrolase [Lactiplantibacillus pentosus]|uniref:alpha-amylase family glycosyl hydrolase n=1 Tax=Lactiplantibacillus pentosus TaxID=1589 RepID=UPI00133039D4|nr:alpha-amylase family glycosyl hydrolase [Lactiplantibacillus pentosus]MBQ0835606.1 alpha-amylase [Lactiplantibacillus pentosus]MBU7464219.1 alpha-amylase [Lactiplantibacillus pentosus]MBU7489482.1 alpha-amylase [Lactiplantibacillus pentosus]MBU7492047.1 alpha-amylase [Lactiplantibacillus pentosus]MBU7518099.1 alpha-amylase [Lactiplantibacillus pentosus]
MARDTQTQLRNEMIYSVFVRNYSEAGNFAGVTADLQRIKDLGTDILWLLPINPIGEVNRKGSLGSPYAIKDYRKINPEYGTLDDFKALTTKAHELGMRVMMDIVYNHTSPDSVLATEHPEWFYHDAEGQLTNKVGDWSDVKDLDYGHHDLWQYQIDTLLYWRQFVDGYRCDVAPLVPLDFWLEARKQVNAKYPGTLWLAESAGSGFIQELRSQGYTGLSDSELYQAFDMTYDYDVFSDFKDYWQGRRTVDQYVDLLQRQDATFPGNYVKMRFLENHDNARMMSLMHSESEAVNALTWIFMQRGIPLIYNGQEFGAEHQPSLFDRDVMVNDRHSDLTALIQKLVAIKQEPLMRAADYQLAVVEDGIIKVSYQAAGAALTAWIPLKGQVTTVKTTLPDDHYQNILTDTAVEVKDHQLQVNGQPVLIKYTTNTTATKVADQSN